ncbi:MAG TPA: hypothetical protein VJ574_02310 [Candidatus Bathyarchaeia archaeon]|nr:hypothetical protein [Candidatus Bathyarchaeia archaeon]
MRYYRYDGKENVSRDEAKEITLELSLEEIERHPTVRFNRFGLIDEKGESIEFIRWEDDKWSIDVPVYENGEYAYCLHEDFLTTGKVKRIVSLFHSGGDWRSMCRLLRK